MARAQLRDQPGQCRVVELIGIVLHVGFDARRGDVERVAPPADARVGVERQQRRAALALVGGEREDRVPGRQERRDRSRSLERREPALRREPERGATGQRVERAVRGQRDQLVGIDRQETATAAERRRDALDLADLSALVRADGARRTGAAAGTRTPALDGASRCEAPEPGRWYAREDSNLWPSPSEGDALSS